MIIKTPFFPFDVHISRAPKLNKANKLGYKVFCIGKNKTGTTSIRAEFIRQGYQVGNVTAAAKLAHYYHMKHFDPIIDHCKSAEVFKDIPFSWPDTYKYLDEAFPDAKFILTVRDSPSQQAHSVINFAKKRFGGKLPTLDDFKKYDHIYPGWSYINRIWFFANNANKDMSITEIEKQLSERMFDLETLMHEYVSYNQAVEDYFRSRPEKLLVINVGNPKDYTRFCEFFDLHRKFDRFPWENKT
jgi:hypothetical protein